LQRLDEFRRSARLRFRSALPKNGSRRKPTVRLNNDEVKTGSGPQRANNFASPLADGSGRFGEEEGDVASDFGCIPLQLVATQTELPDSVESEKNGGGIAGSSGQPRFSRDPLEEFDMNALVDTRFRLQQLRGLTARLSRPSGTSSDAEALSVETFRETQPE